jgi:hypothetical protein
MPSSKAALWIALISYGTMALVASLSAGSLVLPLIYNGSTASAAK